MLYDPPTNVTTAVEMVGWINSTTSQWLFQGILGAVFVITLVSMLKNEANTASKCFAAASFTTMMLAVFARVLNVIPGAFMNLWIIMVGMSAIWMYIEGVK